MGTGRGVEAMSRGGGKIGGTKCKNQEEARMTLGGQLQTRGGDINTLMDKGHERRQTDFEPKDPGGMSW